MTISTRLTKRLGLKHPIVLAPMTPVSSGVLASAVADEDLRGVTPRHHDAAINP